MSADLEARKRRLEELKAQREAKARQVAELVEAKAPLARGPSAEPSPAPTAEGGAPAAPAAPRASSQSASLTVCSGLGEVDVPPTAPPPKECYERASLTDHVFVYSEARPHPDEVTAQRQRDGAADGADSAADGDGSNASFAENSSFNMNSTINVMDATHFALFKRMGAAASSKVTHSTQFAEFLRSAGLVVSETLRSETLKTLDAARGIEDDDSTAVERVTLRGSLLAPAVRDKVVTGVAYQPGSSEFCCASYASHEAVPGATDDTHSTAGVVLVWSTRRSHSHPIFVLSCPEEVSTIAYSPFNPEVIIGGTFTGRVVLWDPRASSQPIMTSFPTADSHSMAVFHAQVIGRENSNMLVTASGEGRVCTWSVKKPRYPLSGTNVTTTWHQKGRSVYSIVVEGHELGGSARMYVGSGDGSLYAGTHTTAAASRDALECKLVSRDHKAAVTALDVHPLANDSRFAGLLLSASTDWSCRLWRSGTSIAISGFSDFVYDAKWSPTHPAVFAACDASGTVSIWNLAESMEVPAASITLVDSEVGGGKAAISITKIAWNDIGDHIIAGGSHGECFVLGVHKSLVDEKGDQTKRFIEVLNNLLGAAGAHSD